MVFESTLRVKDKGAWRAAVYGVTKNKTQLAIEQ